ncbi:CASP-like protein 4A3 [Gastrolobium bilobum]|uniref:CASP-like protein 4A3 n=1 Tax=Gastrolobium bilobum TaxID=150636 RepID=UPI002AB14793|nr:CASP-like protein 4A3 [Gastrolobium bilobum]
MKKSVSRGSESSPQFESPNSFHSPMSHMRWEGVEPPESPEKHADNSKAIVAVGKCTQKPPPENPPSEAAIVFNRPTREEPLRQVNKVGPVSGGSERRWRPTPPAGWKTEEVVRKAALGFRLSEVVVCLISFSVMAADKTQGWSGDSFYRYKEYRYCLCVNVIAFAYSGLQACDLAYQFVTGKHMISHHLRHHFDFFMDQVLAYLLISASSSAATRVDDWVLNWGKDEFTELATASVGMAFLAFMAFAMSSLISGYSLCTRSSI